MQGASQTNDNEKRLKEGLPGGLEEISIVKTADDRVVDDFPNKQPVEDVAAAKTSMLAQVSACK